MTTVATRTRENSAVPEKASPVTRGLLICGVLAGPLFVGVAVIQGLTRQGFDLTRHPISLLSLGDLGWIQIANFIASGLLTVACAVGMRRLLHRGRGGTWGPLLLGAYGIGMVAAGAFRPDPAFGFPPGAPDGTPLDMSWHSALHGIAFLVVVLSLVVACIVFARRFISLRHAGWAAYCVASAVAAPFLAVMGGSSGSGVLLLGAGVVTSAWLAVVAARLLAESNLEDLRHD